MQQLEFSLKSYFRDDDSYSAYIFELEEIYRETKERYAFLALKEETWQNYFIQAMNQAKNKLDKMDIFMIVKLSLTNYINEQIKNKKTRIINNMLILLARENDSCKVLLKKFLRNLELYVIEINEEYFQALKDESKLLQRVLKTLGISDMSLKEVQVFLNKREDIYSKFRVASLSYKENKELVDYIFSCMSISSLEIRNYMQGSINDNYRKIKLYVSNYGKILEIQNLFNRKIKVVDKKFLDAAMLSYTLNELKDMLDDYTKYKYNKSDITFLLKLNNRIPVKIIEVKEEVSRKENNNLNLAKKEDSSRDVIPEKKRKRKYKDVYSYFPDKEELTLEEKKEIIDKMLSELDGFTNYLVKEFFNGNIKAKDPRYINTRNFLMSLKNKYEKISSDFINSKKNDEAYEKKLRNYFPLQTGITEDIRKNILNKLFEALNEEQQKLVNDYFYNASMNERDLAYSIIVYMQNEYKKQIDEILNPNKKKRKSRKRRSLYERFPLQTGITEEIRNKIVDKLFAELSEEQQKLVSDYINRKNDSYKKSKNIIISMQRKYKMQGEKILNSNSKQRKPLYERFPLLDGITEEIRNKIVDKLFAELSEEQQKLVSDYTDKKFGIKDVRYNKVNSILTIMRQKYKRQVNEILNPNKKKRKSRKRRSLYERFPLLDGITEDERRRIVDIIFKKKEIKLQDLINRYIDGKILRGDSDYNKALDYFSEMLIIYRNYGKSLLEEYKYICFYDIINLIERVYHIRLEDISNKKKDVLLDDLKVIEYIYRDIFGMTKEEYLDYFNQRLLELFGENNCSLKELIVLYVKCEYAAIKKKKSEILEKRRVK